MYISYMLFSITYKKINYLIFINDQRLILFVCHLQEIYFKGWKIRILTTIYPITATSSRLIFARRVSTVRQP